MEKTVLITGSSSGFGRASVLLFRRHGWRVAATMRNPDAWIGERSEDLLVLPMDVENDASVDAAIGQAISHFGQIDCVVNNAGQAIVSVMESTPIDVARMIFETNVFAVMRVMQKVMPHFRDRGTGLFINIGSSSAIAPEPLMSVYSASKFAAEGFAEAVRYELGQFGIDVKLVEPGFVEETNMVERTLQNAKSAPVPEAYREYFDGTIAGFLGEQPSYKYAKSDEVAAAIVAAALDETGQFRFLVGEDAQASAHMRRTTSEPIYDAWSRSKYGGDVFGAAEHYWSMAEKAPA